MSTEDLLIPTTLAHITPAWLTVALTRDFPGTKVEAVRTETLHDGTAFTCRVYVTYAGGAVAGPATVCVKSGMDSPHRALAMASGLCVKESIVYQDLLPYTSARVAKCHASGFETSSGKGFVVLEDLDVLGATFCGAERPLTAEQTATGLDQLAELHAAYWNDPRADERRWTHRGQSLAEPDRLLAYYLEIVEEMVKWPHIGAIPQIFHRPEVMAPAIRRLRALDDASATGLIHGDAHLGNFYLDAENRACMADFQCVQRGHYSHDVAMFIGSSLDIVDRRKHERELVQYHAEALGRRIGKAPSFEEAWLGYRRHVLYGLWGWMLTNDDFQAKQRCVTVVFRFGMAALDLDALEAIGV